MSFCNFKSKSDGRRYDFFFHLITALPFPLQNLVQRLFSQTPLSVSSTLSEVSAIPCELFGNTLRALFLKNRDFFWYCEIFLPNTRGPLGCLLGFGRLGQNPAGATTTVKFKSSTLCIKMKINRDGGVVGDGGAVFQCTQPVKYIPVYLSQKASCNRVATPGIL